MILVLHNIRSLHNVGSLFRTADGAGAEKIYLCGITPAPVDVFGRYRSQFAKVSLGAEKTVPWEKGKSTAALIKKLRREGRTVFAVEQAKNSVSYRNPLQSRALRQNCCFVFGAEVAGIPPAVLKLCDKILEIPMYGRKESLNVSVAAGIVLYEFVKRGKHKERK